MLLPHQQTLREHVLMILAETPRRTAIEIHKALVMRGVAATKQGIYKELRILIQDSVVTKYGLLYSLSIPWILSFSQLADRMFDTYVGQSTLSTFIPEGKSSAHWSFRNLALLNDFWVELVFTILKEHPGEVLYNWLPHPWFILLQSVRSKSWSLAMRDMGTQVRTILGHQTTLDQEYMKRQKAFLANETLSFAESPFHGQECQYYEIIGDWLITVTLASGITELVESFFASDARKFEGQWFNDAAARLRADRRTCRLRVERGTAQSRRIRKLFLEYW